MGRTVVGSRLNNRNFVSKLRFSISAAILLLLVSTAMSASPKNVLIHHEGSRFVPNQARMVREMRKELASPNFLHRIPVVFVSVANFNLPPKFPPLSAAGLYREPTIWVRYRLYFAIGSLIILFQLILIFKLAIEAKKRKESEESARKLAGRLIHVQEQERRRIAGELHDDVSQRLALVCLQIDTMRECPPSSPERLVQELSVLYDEADLISSDIHQFSHKLHPSILEKLGLISALRRHCSEFSAHRKIAVDMRTSGAEPSTSPEIALTLFRIGQECLMNVAKHSGANCCNVTLNYTRDKVTLAIEDKGRGFDPAVLKEKTGLGIESMRERLRSVGGTLHINAAPSGGTKIRAEICLVRSEANRVPVELDKAPEEPSNVSA